MRPANEDNKSFEIIWQEWLDEADVAARIKQHLIDRGSFLEFVAHYIRYAQKHSQPAGSATRVLEVGSGTAIDSLYLAGRLSAQFYASDLSYRALQLSRRLGTEFSSQIRLAAGDLRRMCFADKSFDLVFSQGVLEHFHDPDTVIREQERITKKGGLLIIDVPQTYNFYTIWKRYKIRKGTWPYGWETQYSAARLRKIGRRHGLRVLAVGAWGDAVGYTFRSRSALLGFLDSAARGYFRMLNAVVPSLAPYYRQNVTVCFAKE